MAKVLFTPLASEDLRQIWLYLAVEADEDIADIFVSQIDEKCKLISTAPRGFRLRPEFLPNLRSFPHKNYIIFYIPIDSGIEVFRILHGARDLEQLFEDQG